MNLAILLAAASLVATPPAPRTIDPVGDYVWSFRIQDEVVRGTMTIAKADTGYRATFTSDRHEGTTVARSVKVDGNHVVAEAVGEFGEFTLDMQLGEAPIKATYKLLTNDGPASGAMTVERVEKKSPPQ